MKNKVDILLTICCLLAAAGLLYWAWAAQIEKPILVRVGRREFYCDSYESLPESRELHLYGCLHGSGQNPLVILEPRDAIIYTRD